MPPEDLRSRCLCSRPVDCCSTAFQPGDSGSGDVQSIENRETPRLSAGKVLQRAGQLRQTRPHPRGPHIKLIRADRGGTLEWTEALQRAVSRMITASRRPPMRNSMVIYRLRTVALMDTYKPRLP